MRCLVTGGTGLIGSNIVDGLLAQGHEVVATGEKDENPLPSKATLITGDIESWDFDKIGAVDVVFHQAAITDTRVMDEEEMNRVNVKGTKKLFEEAYASGCKRFVYASSTAIYGNQPAPYVEGITELEPLNPYAKSKVLLEAFANEFSKTHPDCVVVGLRYCNVFGPGEAHKHRYKMATMIWQLAQQMQTKKPRIFKDGEQKRDYIYVKDVVRANLIAAKASRSCVVNCGGGRAISFNTIITLLNKHLGSNHTPEYIDNPYEGRYQSYTLCEMSIAKQKIGFTPAYTFEEALKEYYENGSLLDKKPHNS